MNYFLFFFLSVVLLSGMHPQHVSAEKATPLKELLLLELEMAKSGNKLLNSDQHDDTITYIYEKLVALSCFPKKEDSEDCKKYAKKLKEYYPDHVYTQCLEKGYTSQTCRKAFKKQLLVSITQLEDLERKNSSNSSLSKEQQYVDLELKLAQYPMTYEKKELKKAKRNFERAERNQEKEPEKLPETRKKLRSMYKKSIPVYCKTNRTVYVYEEPEENRNIFYFSKSKELKNIDELVAALEKETKEKKAEQEEDTKKRYRVRALTNDCLELLKDAYEFDPSIPEIYCFHDGLTSPRCTAYRKRENKQTNNTGTKKNEGLVSHTF